MQGNQCFFHYLMCCFLMLPIDVRNMLCRSLFDKKFSGNGKFMR